jgi:hypothetical protein
MRLRLCAAGLAAFLLLAAPATAADPIPGALYEGTTEDGNPFQFRVAPDGSAVTDLLSAISITCVGSQGGVEVKALAQKTPFPIAGGAITGIDEEVVPRLEMDGTFTSPTEASGKLLAGFAKFDYSGGGLTSCLREFTWTARTAAPAPPAPPEGGGGGDVGSGPAPVPPSANEGVKTVTKRARAIKRCKRIKSKRRRSRCLRQARRIRS